MPYGPIEATLDTGQPSHTAAVPDWAALTARLGYDPRDTSLIWIERKARRLRRNARRRAVRAQRVTVTRQPVPHAARPFETRANALGTSGRTETNKPNVQSPEPIAYDEIWPPLSLPIRIDPPIIDETQSPHQSAGRVRRAQTTRYSRVLGYAEFYRLRVFRTPADPGISQRVAAGLSPAHAIPD